MRSFYIFLSGVFVLVLVFIGIIQNYENKSKKINEYISTYMSALTSVLSREFYRFYTGYEQGFGTSSGITVIAALLRFFYNINIDEKQLVIQSFSEIEVKEISSLSLIDIKNILKIYEFDSIIQKLDINEITKKNISAPFIVHIEKPQEHFSIYIGSYEEYLMFANPSIGLFVEPINEFKEKFSGYILIPEGREPDKKVLHDIKNFLKIRIKQLYGFSAKKNNKKS